MTCIGKKWDLSLIPEKWNFTKAEAEAMYSNAVKKYSKPNEHISRQKFDGEWHYPVGFTASTSGNERFSFTKDVWTCHGFSIHVRDGVLYARKK